jgi:hypothetical protein
MQLWRLVRVSYPVIMAGLLHEAFDAGRPSHVSTRESNTAGITPTGLLLPHPDPFEAWSSSKHYL